MVTNRAGTSVSPDRITSNTGGQCRLSRVRDVPAKRHPSAAVALRTLIASNSAGLESTFLAHRFDAVSLEFRHRSSSQGSPAGQ